MHYIDFKLLLLWVYYIGFPGTELLSIRNGNSKGQEIFQQEFCPFETLQYRVFTDWATKSRQWHLSSNLNLRRNRFVIISPRS